MKREEVPAHRLTEGLEPDQNTLEWVNSMRPQLAAKYFVMENVSASIELLFGNLLVDIGLDNVS